MIYYLDTSTLKGNINELISLSKFNEIYISGYNLTELISQINEESYGLIFKLFKKIVGSFLKIDWRLPEDVLCKCYNLKFRYSQIKKIKKIYNALLISKNFTEFQGLSEFRNLNFIQLYDRLFTPENDKFQSEENKAIAKEYERNFRKSHRGDNFKTDLLSEDIISIFAEKNTESLLHYILGNLTQTQLDHKSKEYYHKLYNGKLEIYFYALSYYKLYKYSEKGLVGRNDYIDIMHLVYLENFSTNKYFLYNDNIYSRLGSASKLKLIRLNEFEKSATATNFG